MKVNGGSSTIFAKDCDDLAMWVPENGSIPVYEELSPLGQSTVDMAGVEPATAGAEESEKT